MKLLLVKHKRDFCPDDVDGYIVALDGFSVSYPTKYSLDEIEDLTKSGKEIFVVINKNIVNGEIPRLEEVLKRLSSIKVSGILFYDLSVLSINRRLNLNLPLVWNQTHMVTNYNTVQYYYEKGAQSALLSNEITLEEMLEIKKRVNSKLLVNIIFQPVVSFSKRHLVENYYLSSGRKKLEDNISVHEKISGQDYIVSEEENGTTFVSSSVVNGTRPLLSMLDSHFDYGIIDIRDKFSKDDLLNIIRDVRAIIEGDKSEERLQKIESQIGSNTGFFYKKTIYKVK